MKSKKKYVRKKPSRRLSRRKIIFGAIVAAVVILGFLFYSSNQRPSNQQSNNFSFKAAIIDHLAGGGPNPWPNPTFVNSLKNTLESYGFQVDYYECENTTVNFYKSLLARGYGSYGLTIFRVHSAIIEGQNLVGLFTNETYVEAKYHYEGLVKAYFFEEPNKYYFGIAPRFIEAYGSFENTIVILMGCNGLRYNTTAEAFVNKGAKAVIGWDGLVSANHTDQATEYLIQRLVANRWTVKAAVDATMEVIGPETTYGYNTILKYYPPPGDFTIPTAVSILSYRIFGVIVTLTKEELKTGSGI